MSKTKTPARERRREQKELETQGTPRSEEKEVEGEKVLHDRCSLQPMRHYLYTMHLKDCNYTHKIHLSD